MKVVNGLYFEVSKTQLDVTKSVRLLIAPLHNNGEIEKRDMFHAMVVANEPVTMHLKNQKVYANNTLYRGQNIYMMMYFSVKNEHSSLSVKLSMKSDFSNLIGDVVFRWSQDLMCFTKMLFEDMKPNQRLGTPKIAYLTNNLLY
jgi:hypothetical protein